MATVQVSDQVSRAELQAAAETDKAYALIGLVLGGVIALIGLGVFIAGFGGTTPPMTIPLPGGGKFDVPALPAGLVIFLIGAGIIYITRPTVKE